MTGTPMAVNPGGAAQTTLGGLTIVMIMAMAGHQDRHLEGSLKGGYVNSMKMATAGRVRSASTCTVDISGRKTLHKCGGVFAFFV